MIDLDGVDIGESFKISSINLESEVTPTIQGRDFVIATLAAPTVMKEPEKPAEAEAAEGEAGAEGAEAAAARVEINQQLMVIKKKVKIKNLLKKKNKLIKIEFYSPKLIFYASTCRIR